MKIAVASLGDPQNFITWSGIPASIYLQLKSNGHEIHPIELKFPKEPWTYNWIRRYFIRTGKKWFLSAVEPKILKIIGAQLDLQVNLLQPEVVIVFHGDWIAYTKYNIPTCIIHDATFANNLDYYPPFSNLSKRSIELGNKMYKLALEKSATAIFSSTWASESAEKDYGIPSNKLHTIPFGANLPYFPSEEEVKYWISKRENSKICNFLFIGIDWERKGGKDALEFISILNEIGIKSQLTIIGCIPAIEEKYSRLVNILGFLKKGCASEYEMIKDCLIKTNALLLLTHAECFGCVYCEAGAFGLPSLGRDTGGVPEIIKDGKNGFLLNKNESLLNLALRWKLVWETPDLYIKMCKTARQEYNSRLNYKEFTLKLENILKNIINHL